jgi:hypothetical protein
MNKLIKLPTKERLGYDPMIGDIHGYTSEQMHWLTERTVRMCTDIMYNSMQDAQQPYDLAYHAMLVQLIAEIKEHFGLE